MGRYMRKCKGVTGEIAVVEVAELSADVPHGGVTTRSQAALAKEKKNRRRLRTTSDGGEFSSDMTSYICTRRRMMIQPALTTLNTTFEMPVIRGVFSSVENINDLDPQPASCCLSNASGGLFENRMEEAADPTLDRGCGKVDNSLTFPDAITERNSGTVEFRVVEKSRDLMNSSGRMTSEANSGGSEMKMPSESEIEEFFAAAEKDLHKRFSEKYNFDVVKDVPLEGRYEWVHVKP